MAACWSILTVRNEIASALKLLLTSTNLRQRLGREGRELARRFTWKNSAEQSAEFFSRLA